MPSGWLQRILKEFNIIGDADASRIATATLVVERLDLGINSVFLVAHDSLKVGPLLLFHPDIEVHLDKNIWNVT